MNRKKSLPTNVMGYTVGEEIANSITHGIGAALSIAGLTLLVSLAAIYGDVWRVVSFSIYGSSLVLLYLCSTLYHSIQHPKAKRILRIFDHSAIYLLIAGSYTPFTLVSMRGPWGWTLFGVVWGLALLGIAFKTVFIGKYEKWATAAYVLMGWLVVIAFKQMLVTVPPGGIVWLVVGGVVYTLGVLFYAWEKLPYNHAIWHLFVLGGSICHFFAVLFHVLPAQQ
ncbi:PAQR family membrane homeostasis protein TrhA [Candidatus Leptofilum sp.]|uniref:PAQR family membrane homeostasis protein TrhA n=1 Tax=Candidatus Leptofilum sp. TaxID=3241576 RepID=UPI003B598B39